MTEAMAKRRPPVNLSNRTIKPMTYAGGWDVRWDTDVKGLGLRLFPGGNKSFVLSYRCRGRKRLMDLGRYGDMTVVEARRQAKGFLVEAGKGNDPLDARRKAAQGETFRDLAKKFIDEHAKPHKKTWEADQRRVDQHLPSQWFGKRADAIKRADVAHLHSKIGAKFPYEANRVLALLKTMFGKGKEWGFLPEGADNPATKIKPFAEKSRKVWVRPTEVPALATAIDGQDSIYVRSALWLYLLTGVRKRELLAAKRTDVDWDGARLTLTETKAGESQSVPLSGPALAIMQSIPAVDGNPYLFPGRRKGQHLVNIDGSWREVRKAAGLDHVRLHDLRRTVGSWFADMGTDLNRIRDALRHSDISTTLIYARLGDDATRAPFEEHGKRIMEIAGRRKVADG